MSESNLSAVENKNEKSGEISRHLEFSLGAESYAIPLLQVKEVIAVPQTTKVPNTPSHFVGIMNLRGQVISIIDLRKKMGITPSEDSSESAVIIVDFSPLYLGLVIDSVNKVLSIFESEISPAPEISSNKKTANYISGIYRSNNGMTLLMQLEKILDVNDVNLLQKAG